MERTDAFLEGLGKRAVLTADVPGFIVNRFLVPFENDCIRALEAGMGTVESIDKAVELGLGYPMGTVHGSSTSSGSTSTRRCR